MKELIVLYERGQTDTVLAYVRDKKGAEIIVLDYWMERELQGRGVVVRPLTDYVPSWMDFSALHTVMEQTARQWHRLPEMSFFKHKGLALGESAELIVSILLDAMLGHLVFFDSLFEAHPDLQCLTVPHSTQGISEGVGPFAPFQVSMIATVGAYAARRRGVAFKTVGSPPKGEPMMFPKLSLFKRLSLGLYNTAIRTLAQRRPLRLYVSDHWRNVKTFMAGMDDVEAIFVDRKELRHIPLRELWRHRIRFMHPLDALSKHAQAVARAKRDEFRAEWQKAKAAVGSLPGFIYKDFNWWEIAGPVFDMLVETYSERIVADIESVEKILKNEDINRTLLRASISGQHHFFIMGELPRALNLPCVSVELQHGIGVGIFPRDWVAGHMHADYVASYGPFVQKAFVRNGYEARRVANTGSPRFDRYFSERDAMSKEERDRKVAGLGLDPKRPVITVIMTNETTGLSLGPSSFNSYEFRDILRALRDIQANIPGAQYILKFRSAGDLNKYKTYVEELFTAGDTALDCGDAFSAILLGDFVYSCFTTVAGEVLMGRRPMVLFPLEKGDDYFYKSMQDGAFMVPFPSEQDGLKTAEVVEVSKRLINDPAFYKEAQERGERYLAENYTFKGDSTKRVADFLRAASSR